MNRPSGTSSDRSSGLSDVWMDAPGSGARDRAPGLPQVRAELVGAVREHGRGPGDAVLHDGLHGIERRGHVGQARLHVRRVAEPLHQAVQEEHDRQRGRVRNDHDPLRPGVGVGALEHGVGRVGNRRDRHRGRHRRVEVLRDLLRASGDGALHIAGAGGESDGVLRGLERLELGEGGPLGVDRHPASVGQQQRELHDLAADAHVAHQHAGRQLRQVLAQDVLSRATLRRATREHGREPLDHLAPFHVGLTALLFAQAQLLEHPAGAVEPGAQLLSREIARGRGIGQAPELGGLGLQPCLNDPERAVVAHAGANRARPRWHRPRPRPRRAPRARSTSDPSEHLR